MTAIALPVTQGGCLCGAIRYQVEGVIEESGYCHCRTCQKQSGAPVVAWFAIASDKFRYLSGSPKGFRASSRATREFCGDCGTPLAYHSDRRPDAIDITTATLDAAESFPPEREIWTGEKLTWESINESLPQYPRSSKG